MLKHNDIHTKKYISFDWMTEIKKNVIHLKKSKINKMD